MNESVDLTTFRQITGGDKLLESELFSEFVKSCEACLQNMQALCADGSSEGWRESAHALKGNSANIGAHKLFDMCKDAQHRHDASAVEKEAMLSAIQKEYSVVKTFILDLA